MSRTALVSMTSGEPVGVESARRSSRRRPVRRVPLGTVSVWNLSVRGALDFAQADRRTVVATWDQARGVLHLHTEEER